MVPTNSEPPASRLGVLSLGPGRLCEVYPGIRSTLHETNIFPKNGIFEDDFPFPQVGYVSSLEGILMRSHISPLPSLDDFFLVGLPLVEGM